VAAPPAPPAPGLPTGPRWRRRRLAAAVAVLAVVLAVAAWVGREEETGEPTGAWTVEPHTGLSAWVDVYDWTEELTQGAPVFGLEEVDAMADAGVQTLYLQTAHSRSSAETVMEEDQARRLIARANERGMLVVAWYLPTLVDVERDLARLEASAALPVSGLAVDIESTEVADVAVRNERLLALSADLRTAVGPDRALAAITPSAVHLDVVNPEFWPAFPWAQLADTYDALLPMTYWTLRQGNLRDAERYVGDNLSRIRANTGDPDIPVVPIGGVADAASTEDLDGMVRAVEGGGGAGGGLYDWATSTPEQWSALAPLRDLRQDDG
jgi:hypothetical protein